MLKKLLIFLFVIGYSYGQNNPIKITDEKKNNRLMVYALNQTETDYDVKIKITGTNIRQSAAKPRLIRVPGASKVLLKSLVIDRNKQPSYTYELFINDSLSRRVLKPPATPIKIPPRKQIVVYTFNGCKTCDSIINGLNNSKYLFTTIDLSKNQDVKTRMAKYLENVVPSIDQLTNPIVSLGGVLNISIDSYANLIEVLNNKP